MWLLRGLGAGRLQGLSSVVQKGDQELQGGYQL